jgi:hypothetical protein
MVINLKEYLLNAGIRLKVESSVTSSSILTAAELEDIKSYAPEIIIADSLPSYPAFKKERVERVINIWISYMIMNYVESPSSVTGDPVVVQLPARVKKDQKQSDGTSCGFFSVKSFHSFIEAQKQLV